MSLRTSVVRWLAGATLCGALLGCARTPPPTSPSRRGAALPSAPQVEALAARFTKRCGACAVPVWRAALGRSVRAEVRESGALRQAATRTWRRTLTACLRGEGYGGRPVLAPATVRAWLAAPDCARFARAVFAAKACLALHETTVAVYRRWRRTAKLAPRAAPPRKKRARKAVVRHRRVPKGVLRALRSVSGKSTVRIGRGFGTGGIRGGSLRGGKVGSGFGGWGGVGKGGGGGGGTGARIGSGRVGVGGRVSRGPRRSRRRMIRRHVSVKLVRIRTTRGLPRSVVKRVVHLRRADLKRCYRKGLQRRPRLRGRLALQFVVGPLGRLSRVRVKRSTLGAVSTRRCVRATVRRWRFPKPARSTRPTVWVSFLFTTR